MRIKRDSVLNTFPGTWQAFSKLLVVSDNEDGWPTFNCASSVRPCFPPFSGILISCFLCRDLCHHKNKFFSLDCELDPLNSAKL